MKWFWALLMLVLTTVASAEPLAVILIQHDAAGPKDPNSIFYQAEWILWSNQTMEGSDNRLLSLLSAGDWDGPRSDLQFSKVGSRWVSQANKRLEEIGYLTRRSQVTHNRPTLLLENPSGRVSAGTMLLATDGPFVEPKPFNTPASSTDLLVYEAVAWDDAVQVANRIGGRAIIVEYPPAQGQEWTRYWLKGTGWPTGSPTLASLKIPGMLPAREVGRLLMNPSVATWGPGDAYTWGGANRWLDHGRSSAPYLLMTLYWFAVFMVLASAYLVQNEESGPVARFLLNAVALSPAILVVCGALSKLAGLELWPLWFCLASMALLFLAYAIRGLLRVVSPSINGLLGCSLVGLFSMLLLDPRWSDLSGIFGRTFTTYTPEGTGAILAYFGATVAMLRGSLAGNWIGRGLSVLMIGLSLRGAWWHEGHSAVLALFVLPILITERVMNWRILFTFAVLPGPIQVLGTHGICWSTDDLWTTGRDEGAYNVAHLLKFFISPAFVSTLVLTGAITLFGNKFLAYRLRRSLLNDHKHRVLPWMTAACAIAGIFDPLLLSAALMLLFGSVIMIMQDELA